WRWYQRNRVVATLGVGLLATLIGATAVALMLAANASRNEQTAIKNQTETEKALRQVQLEQAKNLFAFYAFRVSAAHAEVERANTTQAEAILQKCEPQFRGWEHAYLLRRISRLELDLRVTYPGAISFSSDGTRIIQSGAATVWDAFTGRELQRPFAGANDQPIL